MLKVIATYFTKYNIKYKNVQNICMRANLQEGNRIARFLSRKFYPHSFTQINNCLSTNTQKQRKRRALCFTWNITKGKKFCWKFHMKHFLRKNAISANLILLIIHPKDKEKHTRNKWKKGKIWVIYINNMVQTLENKKLIW